MTDRADIVADIVVVGGGSIGLSAAHALARRGLQVVVVERGHMAGGTTGNSFAWLNATTKLDDAHYHRLNAAGMARYRDLAVDYGSDRIGMHGHGNIDWCDAENASQIGDLQAVAERMRELDYPHELLDRRQLAELEPNIAFPDAAVGLLATDDRWLDAPHYVRFCAERLRALGGTVLEHCAVTGFLTDAGRLTGVVTDQGTVATGQIVLTAGPATAALATLATGIEDMVPMSGVKGLLVDAPADGAGGLVRHIIHPPEPGGIHFRPAPDGGMLIGAEDMTDELADGDEAAIRADGPAWLLRRVERYLPTLRADDLLGRTRARVGVRPMPRDGRPIVGPLPQLDGLYVMVTHSGVTLGPLLGDLAADEITGGQMPEMLRPCRPDRFDAGGSD